MSLFRRNKRAREEGDEAAATEPGLPGAGHHAADQPAGYGYPETHAAVAAEREPGELDALVGEAPSSRRRGRLRRRLRHLRRVREVLLRDLGGLTFELHRAGSGEGSAVLEGKLARLSAVDREIRDLEDHLSDHRAMIVREPGIGGTCAECGELFGSEARYCWACGHPVATGAGGAPHLAAWTTHPQLAGGAPAAAAPLQAPSVDSTWVEHEQPTAPLPRMDPETVAAVTPAANEPATGDVGGESGAMWSEHAPAQPADEAPAAVEPEAPAAPVEPEAPAAAEPEAPAYEAPAAAEPEAPAYETPAPVEPEPAPAPEWTEPAAPAYEAPAPVEPPATADEAPAPVEPQPEPAPAPEWAQPQPPPADDAPAAAQPVRADDWAPPRDHEAAPELSSGDPLASPQRPAQP